MLQEGSLKISKLQVKNFRNLQDSAIDLGPYINCIFGENGNGKTNILEAIHVLATNKSFRKNAKFPQFLGIDGERPEIIFSSILTCNDSNILSYSGKMGSDASEWFVDGKADKRKIPLSVIFINPMDAYTFHNSSTYRRAWFDRYISQIDLKYKRTLSKYLKL